jgi:hypothetical protein
MSISLSTGSVVAKAGQQISLSSLVTVTPGNNPTYLVVSLLDRNEYTASSNGNTGTLSGDGNTAHFSSMGATVTLLGRSSLTTPRPVSTPMLSTATWRT